MLLKKIRARRADKAARSGKQQQQSPAGTPPSIAKSVFRGKASGLQRTSSTYMAFPPAVTFSMSEDESVASTTILQADEVAIVRPPYQLNENNKESEVAKMKKVIQELQELHLEEIVAKDDEIASLQGTLNETELELASAMAEVSGRDDLLECKERALLETEAELSHTKNSLDKNKEQLVVVSSSLMRTQDKLFETQEELQSLKSVVNLGRGVVAGFFAF